MDNVRLNQNFYRCIFILRCHYTWKQVVDTETIKRRGFYIFKSRVYTPYTQHFRGESEKVLTISILSILFDNLQHLYQCLEIHYLYHSGLRKKKSTSLVVPNILCCLPTICILWSINWKRKLLDWLILNNHCSFFKFFSSTKGWKITKVCLHTTTTLYTLLGHFEIA